MGRVAMVMMMMVSLGDWWWSSSSSCAVGACKAPGVRQHLFLNVDAASTFVQRYRPRMVDGRIMYTTDMRAYGRARQQCERGASAILQLNRDDYNLFLVRRRASALVLVGCIWGRTCTRPMPESFRQLRAWTASLDTVLVHSPRDLEVAEQLSWHASLDADGDDGGVVVSL